MPVSKQPSLEMEDRSWFELKTGRAPILLIAPHGGRARRDAPNDAHRKVNDLYTDDLTRELARRLGASAIINRGMDRNELDCNRIAQLAARAPWMLSEIARHARELVRAHGRLVVLIIHGWNVIQPRVDFGIGARLESTHALPAWTDSVSAGDAFIKDVLFPLAKRLDENGIIASFGLRYPAAGKNNLLQAFTRRHRESDVAALRQLAELAGARTIEAAQVELSVPLRWPGPSRERVLSGVEEALGAWVDGAVRPIAPMVASEPAPAHPRLRQKSGSSTRVELPVQSFRYGMEFYDAAASLGGIASFRFGPDLSRASLLLLCEGGGVIMFSTEDRARLAGNELSLGDLSIALRERGFELRFRGPAISVPDARSCISVEQALASGRLVDVSLTLEGHAADAVPETRIEHILRQSGRAPTRSRFGVTRGCVTLGTEAYSIDTPGRVGFGPNYGATSGGYVPSKTLWVYLNALPSPVVLEAGRLASDVPSADDVRARQWAVGRAQGPSLEALELVASAPSQLPQKLAAVLKLGAAQPLALAGSVEKAVALAHPNVDGTVTYTTLGFAAVESRLGSGHGAFWVSDRMRPSWALL
jgi:hypothetical protein